MTKNKNTREQRKPRARPAPRTEVTAAVRPLNVGLLPNLLGYNMRRAHVALWRDFNRTVGTGIVRPGLFSMMVLIEENPGVAQIELAAQLAIDKATIVGLIRRLQRQGWIERRRSAADRRRQDLFLTTLVSHDAAVPRHPWRGPRCLPSHPSRPGRWAPPTSHRRTARCSA